MKQEVSNIDFFSQSLRKICIYNISQCFIYKSSFNNIVENKQLNNLIFPEKITQKDLIFIVHCFSFNKRTKEEKIT